MVRVTKLETKKVKLIVTNTQTFVQEDKRLVVAKVLWQLVVPYPVNYLLRLASMGKNTEMDPFIYGESVGIAKCSPEDTFDVEKGKKIAVARAESHAYISANTTIGKRLQALKTLTGTIEEMTEGFNEKSIDVVDHNNRYITDLGEEK